MATTIPPTNLPPQAIDAAPPTLSSIPPTSLPVEVAMSPSTGTIPPLTTTATSASMGLLQNQTGAQAPNEVTSATGKASTLQVNIDKVKEQLHKHGGKTGVTLANALQGQADALAKVQIVGDINSHGVPHLFYINKAGGIFSKDDVVLDSNHQPLFYLTFPHTPLSSSWSLSLHHQSREGPLLGTLMKSSYGLQKDDITINLTTSNGQPFKTILTRPSLLSKAHDFVGVDGRRFKWKGDGPLSQNMKCIDLSNGHIAATWEKSYSYGKDGKLLINPAYLPNELYTIVATGLAMEEWKREEEEKGGKGGALSSKNMIGMGMKFLKK